MNNKKDRGYDSEENSMQIVATFITPEGEQLEFKVIAQFEHKDHNYAVLTTLEEEVESEEIEILIFRFDNNSMEAIESEEEFEEVYDIFEKHIEELKEEIEEYMEETDN